MKRSIIYQYCICGSIVGNMSFDDKYNFCVSFFFVAIFVVIFFFFFFFFLILEMVVINVMLLSTFVLIFFLNPSCNTEADL